MPCNLITDIQLRQNHNIFPEEKEPVSVAIFQSQTHFHVSSPFNSFVKSANTKMGLCDSWQIISLLLLAATGALYVM